VTAEQISDAIIYQLNIQLSGWHAIANGPESEIALRRAEIELARTRVDALQNMLALMAQIASMEA
jgi:hypothetical protein